MSHSEPSKLAASKPATTDQKAQNPPLFALAAVVISDFIIVFFVPVSEKLCQSQAAQLSSTEHPSAYQQAQHLMLVTFVIRDCLIILAFVFVSEEMTQSETAEPVASKPAATDQQA